MLEIERTSVTVKFPYHMKGAFGGTQKLDAAIDYFSRLSPTDEVCKVEIAIALKVTRKAKYLGADRGNFWIAKNEMHATYDFDKAFDAHLFQKLID